jgi:hypothetical protein
MKKPWYQRLITSYLLWILAGFLFVSSFLDAISKSLNWITSSITYYGTFLVIITFLALTIALPRSRILWVTEDGQSVYITAIGIKPVLILTGILMALWIPRLLNTPGYSQVVSDSNLDRLAATIIAIENERQSLRATSEIIQTQQAIIQHADAYATQTALVDEVTKLMATVQVLIAQAPVTQVPGLTDNPFLYFTANQAGFCYDGPSTSYEAHWDFATGDTVPVLAKWSGDPNWLLVDIDFPALTRTDCCWVMSSNGTLNVSLDELKTTSIVPDRLDCSAVQ